MALRGNLKDFSLPDVFQLVTFSRKTGVLRIEREDGAHGSVWFRDGDVFFAQSNWHTELLGERLVRAQRLTAQALGRALAIRTTEGESGRRLGTILVDEGYITLEVLESFVSEQIQETIFDLMRWDEGDFDFEAMPEAVEEDIGLSVSIENVIMEGSRRLEEWTRIKKKIPSVDVVFKMATAPGEGTFEISLKPMEWNLLLLVDGTRSIAELAYETDRTDFEVARIIYGLFSAGLLEFAADEEIERLRAERAQREEKRALIEAERFAAEKLLAEEAEAREAEARALEEAQAREAEEAEAREAEARALEEAQAREAEARALEEAQAREAEEAQAREAEEARVRAAEAAARQSALEAQEEDFREPPPAASQDVASDTGWATEEPADIPQFLGGMSSAPNADDAAVLEEMMGAVLRKPARVEPDEGAGPTPAVDELDEMPAVHIEPHVAAEDPAFMAVDHVDIADLPMMPVPSVDDLLSDLADLKAPDFEAAATDAAASAVAAAWDDTSSAEMGHEPETSDPSDDLALADLGTSLLALGIAGEPVASPTTEADLVRTFETAPEPEPEHDAEPEAEPEPEPQHEAEPEPEPEPEPRPIFEFTFEASPTTADVLVDTVELMPEPEDDFAFDVAVEPASLLPPEPEPQTEPEPQPEADPEPELPPAPDPQPESVVVMVEPEEDDSAFEPEPVIETPIITLHPAMDFERDLMALGLGELPVDIFGEGPDQSGSDAAAVVPSETVYEWVETPQLEPDAAEAEASAQDADFSELLDSLDSEPDMVFVEQDSPPNPPVIEVAADVEFDEELLREDAAVETGGVISTDAFLDDITTDDLDFSGGLTDELSALTGADRPSRPTANVNRIPASGELLHRDARVDKDALLKIIEGIKNL